MKLERRNFIKSAALLAVVGTPGLGFGGTCTDDATLLAVGLQKQLLLDNLLVESVQDVTREWHQPRKYEGNPLIVRDKPWEHVVYFRSSTFRVLHDPKDKLFKCWYLDEALTNENHRSGVVFPLYRDLYAYSEDGIHWVKPGLGIYRENGQDTNIYFGDQQHGGTGSRSVIIDPFESDEKKRFKTVYYHAGADDYSNGQIEAAYSADGVHWTRYEELPSFGRFGITHHDCTNLTYDLDRRLYILTGRHPRIHRAVFNPRLPKTKSFFRAYYPTDFAKMNKRRIYQSESKDLIHWNTPAEILAPDEEDNLDDSLYGMSQYWADGARVGLLNVLHQVPDVLNTQLAYSLDGQCWKRVRKPWLTAGPEGSWDQVMVEAPSPPLEMGDELWVYYGGSGFFHHDWYSFGIAEDLDVAESKDVSKGGFFMGLAKLRLDGFCSLDAGPVREGIFVTRPLGSPGTGVIINAECGPGGYIDVEIFNSSDEALPDYSRKDFDRFTGNAVQHQLSWQSRTKIPTDTFRRLIFYMRNAKLYSLRFSA